jgi:hypothetical protein
MRFLDEDATSESDNLVSTVKVERLASILDPWCGLQGATSKGLAFYDEARVRD